MLRTSRSLVKLASRVPPLTLVTRPTPKLTFINIHSTAQNVRFSSERKPPPDKSNGRTPQEDKIAHQTLKSDPSAVTTESSTRHVFEGSQGAGAEEHDMMGEIKHDVGVIKDAFRFKDVPRQSHIIGLAGSVPYVGTSLSTLYLSWDLNKHLPTGNSFYDAILTDHETARYLLDLIEPIQLGYGAVLITYLGLVHWVWEFAEKKPDPDRKRFRYTAGLVAPIVAWPTLYLPIEYALTTQFFAFVALYYVDARASTRGWAPYWYNTYRFLLTAMVGLAIFVSLVGRAQIGQAHSLSYQGLEKRMSTSGIADKETDWAKLEKEEKERIKKEKKAEEKKAEKEEQEEKQKKALSKAGYRESGDSNKAKNEKNEQNEQDTDTDTDTKKQADKEQDEKEEDDSSTNKQAEKKENKQEKDKSSTDEESSEDKKSDKKTKQGDKEETQNTEKSDGASKKEGDKEQGSQS